MDVRLTADQLALIQDAITSGRLHSEEEAVQQALALWEERERERAEILASLQEAEESLDRGEGREFTPDNIHVLAEEVVRRERERLAAMQSRP